MLLLNDEELVKLIVGAADPLVSLDYSGDWYSKESPIQPSSVDLTVGELFIPPRDPSLPGATYSTVTDCVLNTGQTALICTAETVKLPNNIGAIGFPPSHVSINGLLMTNPGPVDPGFHGNMHLTVINMGQNPFALRKGDAIVTVLFFRLSQDAKAGFGVRYGSNPIGSQAEKSLKLAFDFVNVENRATKIAKDTVKDSEYQVKRWTVWTAIIVAVLGILGGTLNSYFGAATQIEENKKDNDAQIQRLRDEINKPDSRTPDSSQRSQQISDLQNRVAALEHKGK